MSQKLNEQTKVNNVNQINNNGPLRHHCNRNKGKHTERGAFRNNLQKFKGFINSDFDEQSDEQFDEFDDFDEYDDSTFLDSTNDMSDYEDIPLIVFLQECEERKKFLKRNRTNPYIFRTIGAKGKKL